MGRKINMGLVFGIALVAVAIVFAVAMTMNISTEGTESPAGQGITLITDSSGGRVFEIDNLGNQVWENPELLFPQDAERLENGNTLIADFAGGYVIEVDNDGYIVWDSTDPDLDYPIYLVNPVDAERLANGNTLIADAGSNRVIEVESSGYLVWDSADLENPISLTHPQDAERLENGNTLIADTFNLRVIEVDILRNIVWEKTGLLLPWDAERLGNGNTLITEAFGSFGGRVIEVDSISKEVVWEKTGLVEPMDAERLGNGNTLIADAGNGRVIEVDNDGNIVWKSTDLENPIDLIYPMDVERYLPPIADAGPDQVVQAGDGCLAMVTLDGTASSDPDGGLLAYTWTGSFGTVTGPTPTVSLDLGTHITTLTVANGSGGTATDTVEVTVEDRSPPDVMLIDLPGGDVGKGKGRIVNKITVHATDDCSEVTDLKIIKVEVYNNGGNLVKGRAVYEIYGSDIFVYPRGNDWSVCVTATVSDTSGNTTTEKICKTLLKYKK